MRRLLFHNTSGSCPMPFDPLTIVFAVVAVLVVWKLNAVLGQNTGFLRQRPPQQDNRVADRDKPASKVSNVVRLPGSVKPKPDPARWDAYLDGTSSAGPGLEAIAAADPNFAPGPFLDGARTAYEAIVTAFASGERRTLMNLLASDVYDGFNAAILEREKKRETLTTTFVSVDDAKFRAAGLNGQNARVAVRFTSKQISATHGPDGELRSGSPDRVGDMDDVWTFSRDITSRDPNWKLVATESGH